MLLKAFLLIITLSISRASIAANDVALVLIAAKKAVAKVKWQENSILKSDFTCRNKTEFAILGISNKSIVIAVFAQKQTQPIDVMYFSSKARNPKTAVLTSESLDFNLSEFKNELGWIPDGLEPSTKCFGLNLTDNHVDSAHIYWHKKNKRFESWSH